MSQAMSDAVTITRHGGTPDHPDSGEYRAHVPGSDGVGRLTWVRLVGKDGSIARVADHTLVPEAIGGRGVAAKLVEALIADARSEGFRIVPACSYVAAAFSRHPEWDALRA